MVRTGTPFERASEIVWALVWPCHIYRSDNIPNISNYGPLAALHVGKDGCVLGEEHKQERIAFGHTRIVGGGARSIRGGI